MLNPVYTTPNHLGLKNEGPGAEPGLGIMNTIQDGEIRLGFTLQIDLSAYLFNSVMLTIDSIDPPSDRCVR